MYGIIKEAHISLAMISFAGFMVRARWAFVNPLRLQQRWIKTAPHIIDTLLFGCGIYLAITLQQNPWQQPWLAAKLLALAGYIVAGTCTLKLCHKPHWQGLSALAAVSAFSYMVWVAITRQPLPFL